MSGSAIRTALLCVLIACAAFAGQQAAAQQLPEHVGVTGFGPNGADFPDEFPFDDVEFGRAVAIRNGLAFIGAPGAPDGGHVAVLNLTTSGWRRVDTLKLSNPLLDERFGSTLAFRDGVLVVGAAHSAYVMKRSNGVWVHRQRLVAPDSGVEIFPAALRYEAGILVASGYRSNAPCLVYVYQLNSTGTFMRRQTLRASDAAPGDNFGADLSMTDRAILVGAPGGGRVEFFGLPQYDLPGAAYLFRRNSSGTWVQGQKLVPAVPAEGFGTAVAIDNDMILVGAPKVDFEFFFKGGAVYGFLPGAGRYVETFKLQPRIDEFDTYLDFGHQIAMFGRHIAIGAVEPYGLESIFPLGYVYTYTRDGSSVLPRGVAAGHSVAASLELANNLLLVGTPFEGTCTFGCGGGAALYDVNRFKP